MDGFVIFILIAGAVVGLIIWGQHSAKLTRQRWQQFATTHGLQYTGGVTAGSQPHMTGWYGRTHVTICTVTRGSGKNRHTYTQFHGHVNVPMPQGLNLSREGFFNRMGKFFGGQDVQLGDKQLDDAFLIKAHDVMGAFSLMRIPQVKQALLTFLARHPNMQLNEKHMLFEETGVCSDMARMKAAVDDLAYLGQTLEAGYNDLAGSQTATGKPQTRTRTRSKGALPVAVPANPAAAAEILQTRSDAVAGAARAAHRQHTANVKAASELDRRDAEATVAEFDRQRAAREAEHDRKMNEIRAQRERRVAEMRDDEAATASAAQTGNRPVANSAGGRTAAEEREVGRLADAFHKLEQKMAGAGAFRAEDVAAASSGSSFNTAKPSEFAVTAPTPPKAAEVSSTSVFEAPKFEMPKFESPKFDLPKSSFGGSFGGPVPAQDKPLPKIGSFDELVAAMSDSSLFSKDRERMLSAVKERAFIFNVKVERIERTFGFDLPDNFREGRTIEGTVQGKNIRVAARYPATENSRIDGLPIGKAVEVQGCVVAWDDLFKKATLDSF